MCLLLLLLFQKRLEWNAEGRRKRGKPREQWMDGVTSNIISKDLTEEETIMVYQTFPLIKVTFSTVEKSTTKKLYCYI